MHVLDEHLSARSWLDYLAVQKWSNPLSWDADRKSKKIVCDAHLHVVQIRSSRQLLVN